MRNGACSSACGWCGACTPDYGPSVNETGGRAKDLPVPIPNLAERVEAAKAARRSSVPSTAGRVASPAEVTK